MTASASKKHSKKTLEDQLQAYRIENEALKLANDDLQRKLRQGKIHSPKYGLSQDKYREIIESIQEGYFETDLDGRITYCNQALTKISGHSRQDLIGTTFRQLTPPRTARAMRAVFGRVYKSGQGDKASHFEVFHRQGRTLTIEFSAVLIRDQQGKPIGFRGILRDVSEQVKAADKERQLQAQLQQAQKMEALGTLAGGLAHGFNNVLMAIQGNLSLMSMTLTPDHPLHKHLQRIHQSAEKGTRLAREILSFAKAGKFVVMETNLNKILKSTSRMFVRTNPGLRVHEIYQEELWPTRVDRVQIGQVLLGLYMHASEAMPGGGDLYIQSENVFLDEAYTVPYGSSPGRYVKISVTDSGVGLDEGSKLRIFEPFFSPYRPLRYEGLGLAAAYGIIRSHSGLINVYSEKGHGTTFNFYLPAASREPGAKAPEGGIDGGSETILLVDGDPTAVRAGREILEGGGYRVITADNGSEALEIYKEYGPDIHLVLLDVILPDLQAEQVYRSLKKSNPATRVLLTSGFNVNKQISDLLHQGCVGFIQKPFQTLSLANNVRAALDKGLA
jgi:two-component system, cell cycle sensor histidine kinase and response regulator CckA